jgi:hypothetical protein
MPLDDPEFVQDDREYLEDKAGGGKDGRRGFQYEMRYGAWEIIKLAQRVRHGELDAFKTTVTSQMPCYIDDLVIDEGTILRHFEMKSGHKITWGNPKTPKTLSWNFARQQAFDAKHGRRAEYTLVLANLNRYQVLEPKAPERVMVISFPLTYKIHVISAQVKSFVSSITDLLSLDKRNHMLALLAGRGNLFFGFDRNDVFLAFCDFNKVYDRLAGGTSETLHDVLEDAVSVSRGHIQYDPVDISQRLKTKLEEISDIRFETCEGSLFFRTAYGVTGRFPAAFGTQEFRDFAAAVIDGEVQSVNDVLWWANRVLADDF